MSLVKIPKLQLVSEANSSENPFKKNKRHKMQKNLVKLYLKNCGPLKLPVCVTLTRFSPRLFDKDNLQTSFKYVRDEIADVICGEKYSTTGRRLHGRNDDNEDITWEYKQEKTTDKEHYITIEIQSL